MSKDADKKTVEQTQHTGADLASFAVKDNANDGATMQVCHPETFKPLKNDDGSTMTITLAGVDSDKYRQAQRSRLDNRLKQLQKTRKIKATAEQLEEDALDAIVECTLDWNITYNGTKPDCTPENVREAYETLPWLFDQVDEFINDRGNYLKN